MASSAGSKRHILLQAADATAERLEAAVGESMEAHGRCNLLAEQCSAVLEQVSAAAFGVCCTETGLCFTQILELGM